MGFKIATAYARLSQSLLGIFQKKKKKLEPKRFNCSTLVFRYHSSIIALNTFRASQTHPNRGCLSHYSKHDIQCPKVDGPNLDPDTRAILFLIFSSHGPYSLLSSAIRDIHQEKKKSLIVRARIGAKHVQFIKTTQNSTSR